MWDWWWSGLDTSMMVRAHYTYPFGSNPSINTNVYMTSAIVTEYCYEIVTRLTLSLFPNIWIGWIAFGAYLNKNSDSADTSVLDEVFSLHASYSCPQNTLVDWCQYKYCSVWIYFNILWTRKKWSPFRRRQFQMHFREWKCMNFDWNVTEVYSLKSDQYYSNVGLDSGLAPTRMSQFSDRFYQ